MNVLRQRKSERGFTLIELLVVIAIIGILATLILIALAAARSRARDARVELNLNQAFTICTLRQESSGDYSGCVVADATQTQEPGAISKLDADTKRIDGTGGATGGGLTIAAKSDKGEACILTTLNAKTGGTNKKFCRDTQGNVSPTTGATDASCSAEGVCTPGTP